MLSNIDYRKFFENSQRSQIAYSVTGSFYGVVRPICAPVRFFAYSTALLDRKMCEEVLEESSRMIAAIVRRSLPNHEEDLTHEVLLKFWDYMRTTKIDWARHRGLLRSMANQAVVNELRAQKRREQAERAFAVLTPRAGDASDFTEGIAIREAVRSLLSQLRPIHKEVLALRYMEGCTRAEICSHLEITPGCCNSRINRAKKIFRRCWQRRYESQSQFP